MSEVADNAQRERHLKAGKNTSRQPALNAGQCRLLRFGNPVGGITYQISAVFQIQFGTNVEAMRFDSFNTAAKQSGDFLTAMSGSDQMQYFKLAGCQTVDQRFRFGISGRNPIQQPGAALACSDKYFPLIPRE